MVACPPSPWTATATATRSIEVFQPETYGIPPGATGASSVFTAYSETGTITLASVGITFYDVDGHLTSTGGGINIAHSSDTLPRTQSVTIPADSTQYKLHVLLLRTTGTAVTVSFAGRIEWTGDCVSTEWCQYGTEPKPGITTGINITADALALICIALGWEIAIPALGIIVGVTLFPGVLCNGNPPDMPAVFTAGPGGFIGGVPTVKEATDALGHLAWHYFCRCVPATPGLPDPVPFPLADPADPPPSLVLPAPLVCDAEDICTTLNAIMSMLANLTYHQSLLQRDVTLIQRQEVPFAYLPGPAFTELTGQGQFGVSAILGLAVAFSALPNYLGTNEADPPDYFEIGEISLGTADGWESRHAIRHAPQLILNVSGVITRVGYSFEPNITATITTLVREP